MTEERRNTARRKVLKGARISYRHLGTSTECTVRNLSGAGACLLVTSSVGVPNEFDLVLGDGTIRHCQIAWRTVDKIGVAFTETAAPPVG
jgi:hypothetical protein